MNSKSESQQEECEKLKISNKVLTENIESVKTQAEIFEKQVAELEVNSNSHLKKGVSYAFSLKAQESITKALEKENELLKKEVQEKTQLLETRKEEAETATGKLETKEGGR